METMQSCNLEPSPAPTLKQSVTDLVEQLTVAADEERRAAVAAVRRRLESPFILMVINGLIAKLCEPSARMRRRAAESLEGLGPVGIPSVERVLVRRRSRPRLRTHLVQVLAAIGRDQNNRFKLARTVQAVMTAAHSDALNSACTTALAILRRRKATDTVPSGTPPTSRNQS